MVKIKGRETWFLQCHNPEITLKFVQIQKSEFQTFKYCHKMFTGFEGFFSVDSLRVLLSTQSSYGI